MKLKYVPTIISVLALIFVAALCIYGQTAAPVPFLKAQYLNSNGAPLAGGKLYTYAVGTSTPLATFTDYIRTGTNTNPVILDSAGRASVFLGDACYKLVMQNSSSVQQWVIDGVCPPNVTSPRVYNSTGTQQASTHIVMGSVALTAGSATVTLTGSSVYTSNATYQCVLEDKTAAAATRVALTNGTTFVITGTGTDTIAYICVGN